MLGIHDGLELLVDDNFVTVTNAGALQFAESDASAACIQKRVTLPAGSCDAGMASFAEVSTAEENSGRKWKDKGASSDGSTSSTRTGRKPAASTSGQRRWQQRRRRMLATTAMQAASS